MRMREFACGAVLAHLAVHFALKKVVASHVELPSASLVLACKAGLVRHLLMSRRSIFGRFHLVNGLVASIALRKNP